MPIPRTNVCPQHNAPYDFVYDAFVGAYKLILAKANRSGGKTINFAILDILLALAHDNCEIANAAAIKPQTQRCYRYVQSFHNNNPELKSRVVNSILSRTDYDDGSSLELLTATVAGMNSPHPQISLFDEVELFNWFVLQQGMNMVKSKGSIKGRTILGSTQKFVSGPMQRLINESLATGKMQFYEWCIWDVMQKPTPEMMPEIQEAFGDDLPANIMEADGFFSWDDLISTHSLLDQEIWETEWLCKRPQSGGLVYPKFSDENNVIKDFVLDPKKVYLFEDCGYALDHPNVVLFVQVDTVSQRVIVFDELYLSLKSTGQIVEAVKSKLAEYGLNFHTINSWIVDPHMLTEQTDRFNLGAPIWGANMEWKVENPPLLLLRNSIPLVRKFIDEGWFKITPNCTNLRSEFMLYSRVKGGNGEFKDEPEKKNDHGPDASRYGLVRLFPSMAFASFNVTRQRESMLTNATSSLQPTYIKPITAGILQKHF